MIRYLGFQFKNDESHFQLRTRPHKIWSQRNCSLEDEKIGRRSRSIRFADVMQLLSLFVRLRKLENTFLIRGIKSYKSPILAANDKYGSIRFADVLALCLITKVGKYFYHMRDKVKITYPGSKR
jgi:hypothetical protein